MAKLSQFKSGAPGLPSADLPYGMDAPGPGGDKPGMLFPTPRFNHRPTSTDDWIATSEDTTTVLRLDDFGNYADADGNPLAAVRITTLPSNGGLQYDVSGRGEWVKVLQNQIISAADIADGRLRFVPDPDENGDAYATIGFRVSDGMDFSTSAYTLTVDVAAVNDAPVARNDSATVNEGAAVTTVNVLGNDSDVDSPLSPASITGFSQGAHGTVVNNGNGTFTYTHDGSEMTSDSFTYTITDNFGAAATATVQLTVNPVNDAPVAQGDGATVNEGAAVTTVNVLGNDSDADSPLTPASITGFSQGARGTVVNNGNGTFTYTHDGSETTSDSFTYTITDNHGAAATATVNVTVNQVNDAPVAQDDVATVNEGGTVTLSVLGNDSDVDSPLTPANISGFSQGAHGLVSRNSDGTFTYLHDGSETTSDIFTYTITDDHGATSTATVHVAIDPLNDAPVIVSPNGGAPATIAINENTTAVTDVDATDADGTALSYSILPTAGTDFARFAIDPVTGVLSFVAGPDFEHPTDIGGADGDNAYVVDVQVSDGQGGTDSQTITVNVQDVATSPPNTTPETVITNAGAFALMAIPDWMLLSNDYGPEDDPSTVMLQVANVSSGTGGFVLPHNPFDSAVHFIDDGTPGGSFVYTAISSSGFGQPATVTIENHSVDTTVLTGGAEDDIIVSDDYGNANNSDRLNGGGGNDWLLGYEGNDVFDGGAGNDIMYGGLGFDVLDFSDGTSGITFALYRGVYEGVADLSTAGLGRDVYYGMEGVIGTAFGDMLVGSYQGDMIDGGAGNDIIDASAGDDMIFAGAGNDIIVGGAGNDTFTFTDGTGNDTIVGFEAGGLDDIIDITSFGFADFSAILAATTNVNGNAVIALDADDSLTLLGVNPAWLNPSDFYFVA